MSFKNITLSLILASCLTITSCTKNPASGGRDFMLMSEDEEFELGHELVRRHIKEYGLYKEKPELTKYYQNLARKLVDVTERSEKPFEFIMLDSENFNAWATPGYINMYRGIMPFFNSEAEFMAVMSHEAGHITARHTARGLSAQTAANALIFLGAIVAGVNSDSPEEAAKIALGAGIFAANVGFSKYSRSNEDEADGLALRYLERMDYDAREATQFYKTMEIYGDLRSTIYKYFNDGKEPQKSVFYDLFDSHPKSEYRAKQVEKRVGKLPENGLAQGRDKYLKMIDGLAFGPNFRKHGTAGKRTIYNPHKQFKIDLPEGYYIAFVNNQWSAYNDADKTKMSLNIKLVSPKEDPEETLRVMYPKLRQLQELEIDGFKAYTGVQTLVEIRAFGKKKVLGKQRVFGIRAMNAGKNKRFFTLVFEAEKDKFSSLDEGFFESANSFVGLSKAEVAKIQPVRVKIHVVKQGETLANLADKMAFGDLREDWFRALNGMKRKDKLQAGQKVKLIVDPNQPL